jgi:hypothetical protein
MGDEAGNADAAKAAPESTETVDLDNATIGSLQGIELIDDKDLMGVDDGKDDKSKDDKSSTENKTADSGSKDDKSADASADKKAADESDKTDAKKVDADKKADADKTDADADKADADKASDKEKGDEKPPKGYVKIEALHEAREINKHLKNENARLKVQQYESQDARAKVELLVTEKEIEEFKNFKPLSDEEFEDKFEDDSKAGLKYLQKLGQFHDFQRRQAETELAKEKQERELSAAAEELERIYATTEVLMEDVLPGIFDDATVKSELTEFAEDIGFTEELFYLTNPETRIILPGESKPLVLGEQAADILKMLVTARNKLNENAATKIDNDKLEAKIEKRLRKEIEKELLAKFKKSGDDDSYKSIDDIPTSENENEFRNQVLSEAELSKLTPAQQDAYLSGA